MPTGSLQILGDWGTTRLRLFLRDGERVVAMVEAAGIGTAGVAPLATLRAAIAPWFAHHGECPIALCGMAGSRNGLVEVPYASCPTTLASWRSDSADLSLDGLSIRIAAGVRCTSPLGTPDVMRGEETQIFGALARRSVDERRHLLVLPGTHSKWALLTNAAITGFHTFPTGELFALLRDHSMLARADSSDEGREAGFVAGLERSSGTAGVLARLFEARSAQLLEGRPRGWALGLLSGLLLGHELKDGLQLFGSPHAVTLVGDPALTALYRQAFAAHDVATTELDGGECAIAGLALLGNKN